MHDDIHTLDMIEVRRDARRRRHACVGRYGCRESLHLLESVLTVGGIHLLIHRHVALDLREYQRGGHHQAHDDRHDHDQSAAIGLELNDREYRRHENQRGDAVGVLEINVGLIDPALHDVDRQDRQDQNQRRDLLVHERREQHRREHPHDEGDLLRLEALFDQVADVKEDGFEDGAVGLLTVDEVVGQTSHHDALGADRGDDVVGDDEVDDRHHEHPRAAQELLAVDHHEQRDNDQIDRRVLLDRQKQQREHHRPQRSLRDDEIEQKEDDRRQEFVLVEVIERAVHQARIEDIDQLQGERHLAGKSQLARDQPNGEHACRRNARLQIKQVDRRAENPVARQEEVEDRREMHAEVGHHVRTLEGGLGDTGDRHALIHLGKDAEVERVVIERAVLQRGVIAEDDGRDEEKHARDDQGDLSVDRNARDTELVVPDEPFDDDEIHHADADAEEHIADIGLHPRVLIAAVCGRGNDLVRRIIRREQHRYRHRRHEQRPRDDIAYPREIGHTEHRDERDDRNHKEQREVDFRIVFLVSGECAVSDQDVDIGEHQRGD